MRLRIIKKENVAINKTVGGFSNLLMKCMDFLFKYCGFHAKIAKTLISLLLFRYSIGYSPSLMD